MNEAERFDAHALWSAVLAKLATQVSAQSFETWFRPVAFTGCDESAIRLTVPNEHFRKWLLENYGALLRQVAADVIGAPREVSIAVETPPETPAPMLPVIQAGALEQAPTGCRWLIERLWTAETVGVLGGAPKTLKSWMAMEMAVSVAAGTQCLGTFPVSSPGPVLLYAAEDSLPAVRARLQSLASCHGVDLDQLTLWVITADSLRLDKPVDQEKLEATIAHYQPRLLVLDPLIRLHALDENASGPMAALLGFFRSLQRKTGTAVALVHHTRKNPAAGGAGHSLRGSSDLYAWLDCFLHLQRRHGQVTLSAEHRAAPPFGPVTLELTQSDRGGAHLKLVAENPAATEPAPHPSNVLPSRILELLSYSSEPLTIADIRSRLHVRKQRLVDALRNLGSQGKVRRLDRGYVAQ